MRDTITLDVELACIVGILPRERVEPQPLHLSLEMGLDLDPCGTTGDLAQSVDYGAVDAQIRYLCTRGQFRLIEVLSVAILRLLLAPPGPGEVRAPLAWASIAIRKPTVLRSAEPGVRLSREAAWAAGADVLADVEEVRAARVLLPAGAAYEGSALQIDGAPMEIEGPFSAPASGATLLEVVSRPWAPR